MLLISWGQAVRGREERSLDVFNEAVGLYGRMQQEGRIESFDIAFLKPNAGMNGFLMIRGTGAQIDAIQDDAEFLRIMTDAQLIVDDMCTCEGWTGEGIAQMTEMFREATSKVPQMS
jgi:hypothetical protein